MRGFRLGHVFAVIEGTHRDKSRYALEAIFNQAVLDKLTQFDKRAYRIYQCCRYSWELWCNVYYLYVVFHSDVDATLVRLDLDGVDYFELRKDAIPSRSIAGIPVAAMMQCSTYYLLRSDYDQTVFENSFKGKIVKCLQSSVFGKFWRRKKSAIN